MVHIAAADVTVRSMLVRAVVVLQQGRGLVVDAQNHRATITTVTAVRAAQRLKLFASHGDATVASATAGNMQDHAVHEFRHGFSYLGKSSLRRRLNARWADASAGVAGLGRASSRGPRTACGLLAEWEL